MSSDLPVADQGSAQPHGPWCHARGLHQTTGLLAELCLELCFLCAVEAAREIRALPVELHPILGRHIWVLAGGRRGVPWGWIVAGIPKGHGPSPFGPLEFR